MGNLLFVYHTNSDINQTWYIQTTVSANCSISILFVNVDLADCMWYWTKYYLVLIVEYKDIESWCFNRTGCPVCLVVSAISLACIMQCYWRVLVSVSMFQTWRWFANVIGWQDSVDDCKLILTKWCFIWMKTFKIDGSTMITHWRSLI